MITHRRYRSVLLLTVATLMSPSVAEAGPLLDWLFQRNRSQTIGAYNDPNNYNNTYYRGPVATGQPRPAFGSCLTNLFRRDPYGAYAANGAANASSPANGYAGSPNVYGQTAGYAPQGGCASGWCQQTVVRWIPQTAYRTAYQQVPVTTYKTSTTINPANGLPLTCTRPCTTYTTQARRVPYTAYRPIYTTVPVTDPLAQQQTAPLAPPTSAGYLPVPPTSAYALQPPAAPPAGCANCQTGGATSGYGGYGSWSNVPGYTPGNASQLPPAVAPRPWADTIGNNGAQDPPGATPWQSTPSGNPYADSSGATPWQTTPGAGTGSGATDWRPLGPNGTTSAPPGGSRGTVPADEAPRLNRPIYTDDGYDDYGTSRQDTVMPDYLRRRITERTQNQLVPRDRPDTSYRDGRRNDYAADPYSQERRPLDTRSYNDDYDPYGTQEPRRDRYPSSRDGNYARSSAPDLTAPSNQADTSNAPQRPVRGIPDLRRQPSDFESDLNFDDRTAGQRRRPTGSRPIIEETTQTRYAASPIEWDNRDRDRSPFDWRKQASRPRSESRPVSAWTPIR